MILPPMVHINIEKNYLQQLDKLQENEAVKLVRTSSSNSAIGVVSAEDVLKNKKLTEEIFGPFSLFIECKSMNQLKDLVKIIPGQLTATILAHKDDHSELVPLVTQLKNKVGRLLFEGVPTGVAVNQAMQHGGPYPASTDGRYTSIGTDAIYRWLRPITFQDCPNSLLPLILQNENPLKVYRLINGQLTKDTL
jgi:NADP-dependent aldehyde dehydrogenase